MVNMNFVTEDRSVSSFDHALVRDRVPHLSNFVRPSFNGVSPVSFVLGGVFNFLS